VNIGIKKELNGEEREVLLDLLCKSFPLNYYEGHRHFSFFLDNMPRHNWLWATIDGRLVGVMCLLNRQIGYFGVNLDLVGLSYMAVLKEHRNFTVTNALKEALFAYIGDHADLSIGFARKALDAYWFPYGYLGFTNFGQLSIETTAIPDGDRQYQRVEVGQGHINRLIELYDSVYMNQFGPLKRDCEIWDYYIKKCKKEKVKLEGILNGDEFVGYTAYKENVVLEIAYDNSIETDVLPHIRRTFAEHSMLEFQIGNKHPLARKIRQLPHEFGTRFAWNGGHIVRVTDLLKFLEAVRVVFAERLKLAGVGKFQFMVGAIAFKFNGEKLTIEGVPSDRDKHEISLHDWQKVIFGVVSVADIETHLNASDLAKLSIMFPVAHSQVPALDQF
jgi:hypothetical protein